MLRENDCKNNLGFWLLVLTWIFFFSPPATASSNNCDPKKFASLEVQGQTAYAGSSGTISEFKALVDRISPNSPVTVDFTLKSQGSPLGDYFQVENTLNGARGTKFIGVNIDNNNATGTRVLTIQFNSTESAEQLTKTMERFPEILVQVKEHGLAPSKIAEVVVAPKVLSFSKIKSPQEAGDVLDRFLNEKYGHLQESHEDMKKFLQEGFLSKPKFQANPNEFVLEAIRERGGLQYFAVNSDPILDFFEQLLAADTVDDFAKQYMALNYIPKPNSGSVNSLGNVTKDVPKKDLPFVSSQNTVGPPKKTVPIPDADLLSYQSALAKTRPQDLNDLRQVLEGASSENPILVDLVMKRMDVSQSLYGQAENVVIHHSKAKYEGINLSNDNFRGTIVVTMKVSSKEAANNLLAAADQFPEVILTAKHRVPVVAKSAAPIVDDGVLDFAKVRSSKEAEDLLDKYLKRDYGHLATDHADMKKYLHETFINDPKFQKDPKNFTLEKLRERGGLQYFAVKSDPILSFFRELLSAGSVEDFAKHYQVR